MEIMEKYTDALILHYHLNRQDALLLRHGVNIILLDGTEILCALLLSFIFDSTRETVLYIVWFSNLRVHGGGYHTKTPVSCFISYLILFLLFVFLIHTKLNLLLPGLLSVMLIWLIAPVEHPLNPLTRKEYRLNQLKLQIQLTASLFLITVLPNQYRNYTNTICITLLY